MAVNTTPPVGASDVEIDLMGENVVLRATLDCARALSREGAGIYGQGTLADRLKRYDLDAYCFVVRAGLGLTGNAVKDLDEQVFRTGMINLIGPLTKFVIGLGDPEKRRGQEGDAPLGDAAAQAEKDAPAS